jgi:hypothetical protein
MPRPFDRRALPPSICVATGRLTLVQPFDHLEDWHDLALVGATRGRTGGSRHRLQAAEAHRKNLPAREPVPIALLHERERLRRLAA